MRIKQLAQSYLLAGLCVTTFIFALPHAGKAQTEGMTGAAVQQTGPTDRVKAAIDDILVVDFDHFFRHFKMQKPELA